MKSGYADVSLADVAANAGLARTAIYNYFPDRETLLFAWTDREVRRTLDILERELADAETSSQKLRVFVRSQLNEFMARHLPPGKEAMQLLQPSSYERFMHHIEPVERMLRDIIGVGMDSGEFGDLDAGATVPLVMACIAGERVPLATRVHTVDEATDRVTEFLLRALRADIAPASDTKAPAKKKR